MTFLQYMLTDKIARLFYLLADIEADVQGGRMRRLFLILQTLLTRLYIWLAPQPDGVDVIPANAEDFNYWHEYYTTDQDLIDEGGNDDRRDRN